MISRARMLRSGLLRRRVAGDALGNIFSNVSASVVGDFA
jgi:tetrahydromethanopterin S-methyltransferase subunit F